MELMSPLLLYALATFLPLALGKSAHKRNSPSDFNDIKFGVENNHYDRNNTMISKETLNVGKISDLQSVFMDPTCKECHTCMEKAIKAHKVYFNVNIEGKTNDLPNEIDNLEGNTTQRNKRNLDNDSKVDFVKKGAKKSKAKKNKNKNKFYSVTKYRNDGKIYALKVKETTVPLISAQQNQTKASVNKCQVYRVKESFSCESPDADLILREKQRNVDKTDIKEKDKRETNLPIAKEEKDKKNGGHLLIKYHVEDSQVSENFMPSIEEMY